MMLSRTGLDRASLSIVARSVRAGGHHGVVWQVRPTGGQHLLLLLLLLKAPPPLRGGPRQTLFAPVSPWCSLDVPTEVAWPIVVVVFSKYIRIAYPH